MTKPTKFDDLKPAELYRSAIEDFAIPVEEEDKGKKKVLLAALLEGGVTWDDYVAQHPSVAPDPEPVAPALREGQVEREPAPQRRGEVTTLTTVTPEPEVEIIVAEAPTQMKQQKWLIKMVRDNLRFDALGHKFTREHPYALVSPEDAEYLLTQEQGFRQATPGELREFYS